MRLVLLLPLALMTACGAPQPAPAPTPGVADATPRQVTLYRDTVTAAMSDGTLCTGVRAARSGPWRTELRGCPHRWPVAVLRPTDQPRLPLAPAAADPWVRLDAPAGPLGFAPPAR